MDVSLECGGLPPLCRSGSAESCGKPQHSKIASTKPGIVCTLASVSTGKPRSTAVFVVTVPESVVLAYVGDRGEEDYLVMLPPDVRPRRLLTLPEPIRPGSAVAP